MKIILICGRARSGKTELAKLLKEMLEKEDLKVAITEYSKYIKLFAKELLGWDGKEPKPRKFLQNFGSMVRKDSHNPHYFIDRMKEDIKIYQNFIDVLIICDVRLPEEINELKEENPMTIHIKNENNPYDLTKEEALHETEHALDDYHAFDYEIENKKIEELREILKTILEKENYKRWKNEFKKELY